MKVEKETDYRTLSKKREHSALVQEVIHYGPFLPAKLKVERKLQMQCPPIPVFDERAVVGKAYAEFRKQTASTERATKAAETSRKEIKTGAAELMGITILLIGAGMAARTAWRKFEDDIAPMLGW